MEREEILAKIRELVGNRRFEFDTPYKKKVPMGIGIGDRPINAVTRKYLYTNCYLIYGYQGDEYGAFIKKYPTFNNYGVGEYATRVALDDMFTSDLKSLYESIKYFLWYKVSVELPQLRAQVKSLEWFERMHEKLGKFEVEKEGYASF